MRNYHKILVEATRDKTVGNHSVEMGMIEGSRYFYYHGYMVCNVDDKLKLFELDDHGYGNYISTKNCLAGYREYFTGKGYKQINPKPIYKGEM